MVLRQTNSKDFGWGNLPRLEYLEKHCWKLHMPRRRMANVWIMGFVILSMTPAQPPLVKVIAYHNAPPQQINRCVQFATSIANLHRISTVSRLRDALRFIDTAPLVETCQTPYGQWRQESYRTMSELGLPWLRKIMGWLQGYYSIIRTRPISYTSQYNNPKCLLAI